MVKIWNTMLIYEKNLSGHNFEYLYHLLTYWYEPRVNCRLIFLVHHDFPQMLKNNLIEIERRSEELIILPIDAKRLRQINNHKSVNVISYNEFLMIREIANKYNVNHCFFGQINSFQGILGLEVARKVHFSISGILFKPYPRIPIRQGFKGALISNLDRLRRKLRLIWMARNRRLKSIFVLNDRFAAAYLNRTLKRRKIFKYLADPVWSQIQQSETFDLRKKYTIGCDRFIFLHFGSLSIRKGVLETLEALKFLNEDTASKITVLFIGRVVENFKVTVQNKILETIKVNPKVQIELDERFIPHSAIRSIFDQCDCVLLPYHFVQASSGILGHAALSEKCVIGPDRGLLGTLIKEYDLGYRVNTFSPRRIAEAMELILSDDRNKLVTEGMKRYVERSSPRIFAETIFSDFLEKHERSR